MNSRYGAPVAGDEKEVLRTSILGMIKHLAYVERGWFQEGIAGGDVEFPFGDDDLEGDFRIESDETTEQILDLYRAECDKSRIRVAGLADGRDLDP